MTVAREAEGKGRTTTQGGIRKGRDEERGHFSEQSERLYFFSLVLDSTRLRVFIPPTLCVRDIYSLQFTHEHLIPPVGHGVETPGCSQDGLNATPIPLLSIEPRLSFQWTSR